MLLHALQRISVDHQTVLELHYWEQLSTDEIAEVCEIATATVRTRLHRARHALRSVLEAEMVARGKSMEGFDMDAAAIAAKP